MIVAWKKRAQEIVPFVPMISMNWKVPNAMTARFAQQTINVYLVPALAPRLNVPPMATATTLADALV